MIWGIQKAVYARLTSHAPLLALVTGVFDEVPQSQAFPYVVIGGGMHQDWDTLGETGFECDLAIDVWDRAHRGRQTVKRAQDEIYAALHRQAYTVPGGGLVDSLIELTESFLDQDGVTFHGVQRLRLVVSTS